MLKDFKKELWYAFNDKKKFKSDILKRLHLLKVSDSQYFDECIIFYDELIVKDKIVIDLGSDFGTSPMCFLRNGAKYVYGFSLDEDYFKDKNYKHIQLDVNSIEGKKILNLICKENIGYSLKIDIEGSEWKLNKEIFENAYDWIIALHYPITSYALFNYIMRNGYVFFENQNKNESEFLIIKKYFKRY